MRLADFVSEGVLALQEVYPPAEARNIVLMFCEAVLGTKSYTYIVEPSRVVPQDKQAVLRDGMDRLRAGEPVQYVTGRAAFCGHSFRVSPAVLIPRPETEMLVYEAVALCGPPPVRALDLCTGSGCIAWSLALAVPGAETVAVDISEEALQVARGQGFDGEGVIPPVFVQADILDTEQAFDYGLFDLIVSNPPYVLNSEKPLMRRNVLGYEPPLALFVPGGDPLLYDRAVARWAQRFLVPGGHGIVEINESLGEEAEAVFRETGLVRTERLRDFFGKIRFIHFEKLGLEACENTI